AAAFQAKPLLSQWDRLVEKDGVLFRQVLRSDRGEESLQLLLPVVLKQDTYSYIKSMVIRAPSGPRMSVAKDSGHVPHSFMGHLLASHPNEMLAIDFTLLEPSRSEFENVLVMTDVFSKFTVAVPTRDQRASTVAQVLICEWFYKFGIPSRLHSDQGRSFESSLIEQLCYSATVLCGQSYGALLDGQC
ncbi:hypothetical protein L3Q82_010520, partial [Scortum barcoo]